MGRILAIDYGLKRTGIAVSDETQTFAFALETVSTHELEMFLKKYCNENPVDAFVVGEPRDMRNIPADATPHIEGFVRRLNNLFPDFKVYRIDERFTSSIAMRSIIDSGVKKKGRREKGLVDQVSATIILQSWIEQQNRNSHL